MPPTPETLNTSAPLTLLLALSGNAALAQSNFITPGGQYANGSVPMCDNGSGYMVPCTTAHPVPVALPPSPMPTQESAFNYGSITSATTTTLKSGSGTLHTVNINALGTVASSVTIYDNTSAAGTPIATINSLAFLGTATYDVQFSTGLTIVTTGVLAPNVTVSYR